MTAVEADVGGVVVRRTRALGTTAEVAVPATADADGALRIAEEELAAVDAACSRFRPDGEVLRLGTAGGRPVRVSQLLFTAVSVALAVAERTGGAVDPTVGAAVAAWGYDRDFAELPPDGCSPADPPGRSSPDRVPTTGAVTRVPGWRCVELDPRTRAVRVPAGTLLDLGASAKALAADRVADRVAHQLGCGALVSLGGDVAVSGPAPQGGWPVGIADLSGAADGEVEQVVCLHGGGLASSSPLARSWRRGGHLVHHIVHPASGVPVPVAWRLVSASGPSCVAANAATTAAVVWGAGAPRRLRTLGLPARLVAPDGSVVTLGGWPPDARSVTGAPTGPTSLSHRGEES